MATDAPEPSLSLSQTAHPVPDAETLSPLEQEVLDEYARLLDNLNNVRRNPALFLPAICRRAVCASGKPYADQ